MQWRVSISGHDQIVSIPDQIADNTPFDGSINGRTVTMRWQRSTRSLFLLSPGTSNLWRSINARSVSCDRESGDPDVSVSCELILPGSVSATSVDAAVSFHIPGQEGRTLASTKKTSVVRSQITGKVIKVQVKPGDTISKGDTLLIIEAMKMENRVLAKADGVIDQVKVSEGDTISTGSELIRFK
jgi:biotin carboxyl carrier protein